MLKKYFLKKGVASLVTVFSLGSLIFIVSFSMSIIFFWQIMKSRNNFYALASYYSSYSGIQDALLKIERNINFSESYNLSILNQNDVSISVTNNGSSITIVSSSSYFNNFKKLQATLSADSQTGRVSIVSLQEISY
ncbi:MAG: hypothetical protein AB7D02_02135 [Candidatus Paceibacterota bacterium]